MNKVYTRINWENEPSINTPINAANLNKLDYAMNEVDNRVIALDTEKAKESDLLQNVKGISYNQTTGVFTFTWQNGSTLTVDLNIEKIPVNFSMSEDGIITMETSDGTEYTCDVASLIKTYLFEDSDQIDFTVTNNGGTYTVTGIIKDGSIKESMLDTTLLAEIRQAKADAQASATASASSASDASGSATASESWAVGGTNTRTGEDTNNAKYWAEEAQRSAKIDIDDTTTDLNKVWSSEKTKAEIDAKEIDIDSALSTTSTNPVQNKVITEEVNSINEILSDAEDKGFLPKELADKSQFVQGTLSYTGAVTSSTTRIVSPYIEVSQGDYIFKTQGCVFHEICFYTSNKAYIKLRGDYSGNTEYTIPSSMVDVAKYVRFTIRYADNSTITPNDSIGISFKKRIASNDELTSNVANIGTLLTHTNAYTVPNASSVFSTALTLGKGTWILMATDKFQVNSATGSRSVIIKNVTTNATLIETNPTPLANSWLNAQCFCISTFDSDTQISAGAYQTSGSEITVSIKLQCVRIC